MALFDDACNQSCKEEIMLLHGRDVVAACNNRVEIRKQGSNWDEGAEPIEQKAAASIKAKFWRQRKHLACKEWHLLPGLS